MQVLSFDGGSVAIVSKAIQVYGVFLSLFENSNATLKEFRLKVPSRTWDAHGIMAQKKIMYDKPNLQTLAIDYDGNEDKGRRTFEYLLHYIQQHIYICGLCSGNEDGYSDSWNELEAYHSVRGKECFVYLRDKLTFYLRRRPLLSSEQRRLIQQCHIKVNNNGGLYSEEVMSKAITSLKSFLYNNATSATSMRYCVAIPPCMGLCV